MIDDMAVYIANLGKYNEGYFNRAGVRSILVKPIINTDSWKTQFNRLLERRIMKYLLKHNPEMTKGCRAFAPQFHIDHARRQSGVA